jgi:precorrin-2 dehydrogenase/sirohydrochlorin ferrochelatase
MLPLVHDFDGATVLVFGGGSVGARKARRFAREARVVVVSPAFGGSLDWGANGSIDRVRAAPDPGDVRAWVDRGDPALVVAATDDPAVNAAAERTARDHGTLVNRADERGPRAPGSVVVPATVREGPVTVAIDTGGRDPTLSRALARRLDDATDGAAAVADLLDAVGDAADAVGLDAADRRAARRAVAGADAVWKALGDAEGIPNTVVRDVIAERLTDETAGRLARAIDPAAPIREGEP